MARVTLQDVATKAGVSLATASKVMNGRGDVKDTTRELVSGIADELGYSPRPRSNGASTQRDPYLVIVFDTLSIPYSVQVLSGVQDAATRAGVDVVVKSMAESLDATPRIMGRQWFRGIAAAGCLAVITVTMKVDARQGSWARANNLPFIAIDPLTPEGNPTLDGIAVRISATNWAGARAATQHLADLGHQRIGIVTGPMSSAPSRERLEGYRTALEAAGIPFDPDLHRAAPNYSFEDGRIAAQELLDSDADPTAILACSDTIPPRRPRGRTLGTRGPVRGQLRRHAPHLLEYPAAHRREPALVLHGPGRRRARPGTGHGSRTLRPSLPARDDPGGPGLHGAASLTSPDHRPRVLHRPGAPIGRTPLSTTGRNFLTFVHDADRTARQPRIPHPGDPIY
jgi:LacI family transcriptional regulator